MEIPCSRCNKGIDSPDKTNADYLMPTEPTEGTIIICPECYKPEDKPRLIWGIHKEK